MDLEIKKIGRSYCVVAGVSVLGKFSTETLATQSLTNDAAMYRYWAGSVSVSTENATPTIINLG